MKTSEGPNSRQMSISLTISPSQGLDLPLTIEYAKTAEAGWNISITGTDGITRTFVLDLNAIAKGGDLKLVPCTPGACPTGGKSNLGGPKIWFSNSQRSDTPAHEVGHVFGFANNRTDGKGSIMSGDRNRGVNQEDFDLLWDAYHP